MNEATDVSIGCSVGRHNGDPELGPLERRFRDAHERQQHLQACCRT